MGILSKSPAKASAEQAVGHDLLAALPENPKPWYRVRHLNLLYLSLLVPLISSSSVGFDGAMMNGLQTLAQWRDYFGHPNASLLGTINAVYPVGKVIGLFPCTWISDRYGRRAPFACGLVLCVIGAAIQGAAQNLPMFIISRFILGFGTAFIAQPSPILVTELAYPTHRGKVTALYNTFYYMGAILAAWSTYGTFCLSSTFSWRIPSILQGAIPVIQFTFFWLVPESPRWLIAHGKRERAEATLAKYHGGGEVTPLVTYEMLEIEENLQLEATLMSEISYVDLVRTAPNRRRTIISMIVGFFAQWNGIGVVSYYLTLVLDTIGITATSDQALINGLLQVFNWISAVLAGALMVDRIGRRPLFLISVGGMLISYITWTALTAHFTSTHDVAAGRAVVAFVFVYYYFFYDIAWTPLLQAYPVEIFPYTLRGRGLTVSLSSTYVGLIIGQFVNPIAMKAIGWKYYIVFCCLLALLFALVWFLFPETKGRTLEQIAEVFDGKKHNLGQVGEPVGKVGDEKYGKDEKQEHVQVEKKA